MPARPPASLEVSNLTFHYPGSEDPALHGVGFRVSPGERVGLLGPNGAGKSTLMRICCGYLPVPRGRDTIVRVADYSVATQSLAVRELVGYLLEQVPLYQELRVREHLEFRARIKRVPRRERAAEIERVVGLSGLEGMAETPIARLSRGYRQRVGIADALLGSPPLVVLDEPTVGLDPNQVQGIRTMLKNLGGNQTLIFSSHILAEVEALCDRVIILSRGQVVADETVNTALATDTLFVEWSGADGAAIRACIEAAWASLGREDPPQLEISPRDPRAARPSPREGQAKAGTLGSVALRAAVTSDGVAMDDLAAAIGRASLEANLPLVRLEPGRRRLEERFAVVTGFREGGG
ncbi:ABC transporter, ATP-binding protein [Enhygromyxa salina]|uniref:ABC transporter, ATP-binding protein n=1 Tax=Enhygromyxa salina TaxID=215803 RepID=A0A0C2DEN7_9BACT|nr:ATP-binding cassette domain-containing protein [Enhygromyxa salina]KIG18142.1 ABC transporter, ATP-binding protein [Enhygromyxa salina]